MRAGKRGSWMGHVVLDITGKSPEAMLNAMANGGLSFWEASRPSPDLLRVHVALRDALRLKPLLRRTGCRMRIKERKGWAFRFKRWRRRSFFIAGAVLFLIGLQVLSQIVWKVDVTGQDKVSEERVLEAARSQGLYPRQWKFRLPDPEVLSDRIQRALPEASWVGVTFTGTRATVQIVEAKTAEKPPLASPRHLVARRDAEIVSIYAETGRPVVKPHAFVRKGDVLISGLIGQEPNRAAVVARGTVRGKVWDVAEIEMPLTRAVKTYTGEKQVRRYLVFGSKGLRLSGYGDPGFQTAETQTDDRGLSWRNYRLPIGWRTETVREVNVEEETLTTEQARIVAMEHARAQAVERVGGNAKLLGENILHEKTDNGKVYMKALFEIETDLTEELAIVP
ncbi:sporulation protein YqfD [Paenibacillus thermoaerophilus]|uniref:Sporulation protein YqfD n=1 Tax=Paenibacillus thermoaerophilus TaxID=1215385 RepID=A0ABW2V1G0_9BACL|nr:sporulation protein YqfD [Paenibacillus thermoaerophilus]